MLLDATALGLRPDVRWENFGGNLRARPVRHHGRAPAELTTHPEVYAEAVLAFARERGLRVRAHGAAWSFSSAPYVPDVLIDMRAFARVLPPLSAAQVCAGVDPTRLLATQPGATLAELCAVAEARGRSLPVTNGRGGPTIAGAISTGSHGSAVDRPPLGDAVRALALVTAPGRRVWLEAASRPTVRDEFIAATGFELIRDDTLLAAAQVSLGCFGLVTQVVLELDEAFDLDHRWQDVDHDAALTEFLVSLDPARVGRPGRLYHANLVMNPHRPQWGRLSTATRVPAVSAPSLPEAPAPSWPLGPVLRELIGRAPVTVPAVMDRLLRGATQPEVRRGRLGTIFPAKVPRGYRTMSWEIAVPRADGPKALELIVTEIRRRPGGYLHPGFVAVRWMLGTRAPLGFTRFAETTTIELPTLGGLPGTEDFLSHLHGVLERSGLRFLEHPGQHNHLDPARLQAGYGERLETWRTARATLLGEDAGRFASAWTDAIGLTGTPARG